MIATIVNFANLLLAALLAGGMFGIWLGFRPAGMSAAVYIGQQHAGIAALNTTMPALGAVTVAMTLMAAWLARGDTTRFTLLLLTAACFIAAGLITRFLNQPINAIVLTWSGEAPPADWTSLRDAWTRWHEWRTAIGVVGLCLLIASSLQRGPAS